MNLNTSYADEFAPSPGPGGDLYFCSDRKTSYTRTTTDSEGDYITNLFRHSGKDTDLSDLNRKNSLTGPAAISASGQRVVTAATGGKGQTQVLGLFFPDETGNVFKPFTYNSQEYSIAQPAFSTGGDTLWFSSDMPGGFGDADIWYSTRLDGNWTKPVNAGAMVNTEKKELFPAPAVNGLLFFSSNRNGQFDIYFHNAAEKVTAAMPAPVNSPFDELSMCWNQDGKTGYLTSNRKGTHDIYSFDHFAPVCIDFSPVEKPELCYTFYEQSSFDSQDVPLRYEWKIMGNRYSGEEAMHCFPSPGIYPVELNVIDSTTGDIYFNEATYDHEIPVPVQVSMKWDENGSLTVDSMYSNTGDIHVEGLYFSIPGKWPIQATALKTILHDPPFNLQITVKGKSSMGLDTCLCFVQPIDKKPEETVTPLVASVSASPQITRHPVPDIQNTSSLVYRVELMRSRSGLGSDHEKFSKLPEGMRAEEWYIPGDSVYSYTVGSSENPMKLYEEYATARKAGFKTAEVKGFEPSRLVSLEELDSAENLNNAVFRASNIYFKSASHAILPESEEILDQLADFMSRRANIIIEISAHTDSEGSDSYNTKLSERRAASIMQYLTAKGIDRLRLVARGYGEFRPVGDNRTAEGRALNRRIEFRILDNSANGETD